MVSKAVHSLRTREVPTNLSSRSHILTRVFRFWTHSKITNSSGKLVVARAGYGGLEQVMDQAYSTAHSRIHMEEPSESQGRDLDLNLLQLEFEFD